MYKTCKKAGMPYKLYNKCIIQQKDKNMYHFPRKCLFKFCLEVIQNYKKKILVIVEIFQFYLFALIYINTTSTKLVIIINFSNIICYYVLYQCIYKI